MSADVDGGVANADAIRPVVSADGRFVAFDSEATDLVSGDTNQNTDVFVRDQVTGSTERVSVTWKGQEPRGDSKCPAISADGRHVAFLSNAWNMYAGGANLGSPRWDVYVRDRDAGTTERVSVNPDGSDADADSFCPLAISGDGGRIAFGSWASLAPADPFSLEAEADVYVWDRETGGLEVASVDTDGVARGGIDPALSADGSTVAFASWAKLVPTAIPNGSSLVYVRDLSAGVTTVASLDPEGSFSLSAGDNTAPSLSDDGRVVAFLTRSRSFHVLPQAKSGQNVILFDRDTGTSMASGAYRPMDCGHPAEPFQCNGGALGRPSISGDGRFVTYSTRAMLLPAAYTRGDQVYVFDRITGRLRRVSVGPHGTTGDSCSLEPSISGDGETVVYRSSSTNIAGDADILFDAVDSRWRCHDDGCWTPSLCPPEPQVCEPARRATLRLKRHAPGDDGSDRLFWKWIGERQDGEQPFGDPSQDARYELCLYAHNGARLYTDLDQAVLPGETWSRAPRGFVHRASGQGLSALSLRNLKHRSLIVAKGRGQVLGAPHLPLTAPSGVSVQLHDIAGGRCWGSYFSAESIERNYSGHEPGRPAGVGRFTAKLN